MFWWACFSGSRAWNLSTFAKIWAMIGMESERGEAGFGEICMDSQKRSYNSSRALEVSSFMCPCQICNHGPKRVRKNLSYSIHIKKQFHSQAQPNSLIKKKKHKSFRPFPTQRKSLAQTSKDTYQFLNRCMCRRNTAIRFWCAEKPTRFPIRWVVKITLRWYTALHILILGERRGLMIDF